jgi:pantoate--beta-alanine ligase
MGALHDGHMELVRRARARSATVAVSIFVNPLQFGPGEDLARYPRDLQRDRERLSAEGVDVLFTPETQTMYPAEFSTFVEVDSVAHTFEGAARPGHFRGVMTVLAKLLHLIAPDALFMGQKDAQQAVLTRKMIADLDFPVALEIVPTVREPDGLAMSSRNRYLDAAQRAQAPTLYAALRAVREALARGAGNDEAFAAGRAALSSQAHLEYLDLVDGNTFAPLGRLTPPAFVIGAARFGTTRLIDNVWLER